MAAAEALAMAMLTAKIALAPIFPLLYLALDNSGGDSEFFLKRFSDLLLNSAFLL